MLNSRSWRAYADVHLCDPLPPTTTAHSAVNEPRSRNRKGKGSFIKTLFLSTDKEGNDSFVPYVGEVLSFVSVNVRTRESDSGAVSAAHDMRPWVTVKLCFVPFRALPTTKMVDPVRRVLRPRSVSCFPDGPGPGARRVTVPFPLPHYVQNRVVKSGMFVPIKNIVGTVALSTLSRTISEVFDLCYRP